jgi:carbon starvation protein
VTPEQLTALASSVGEASLLGRVGGAPSLAVGMAHIFSGAFGASLMGLWYHFAIMFEALFILTTLDAVTRVGVSCSRNFWRQSGPRWAAPRGIPATCSRPAGDGGLGLLPRAGVLDPLGGINSLWPLFGISNQLLAAVALCVGTTLIIKAGKARYAWVTLLPLAWLLDRDAHARAGRRSSRPVPRLGFLAHARASRRRSPRAPRIPGGSPADLERSPRCGARRDLHGRRCVALVIASIPGVGAVIRGRKPAVVKETPFVESVYAG